MAGKVGGRRIDTTGYIKVPYSPIIHVYHAYVETVLACVHTQSGAAEQRSSIPCAPLCTCASFGRRKCGRRGRVSHMLSCFRGGAGFSGVRGLPPPASCLPPSGVGPPPPARPSAADFAGGPTRATHAPHHARRSGGAPCGSGAPASRPAPNF